MLEIFQYDFMLRAFAAGIAVAIVAPLVGIFLMVKRFSLIADTLSHIALSGVAVGMLLNIQPLPATLGVTVAASLLIERLRVARKIPGEAILAMFLPGGLALSIVLIALAGGFNANLFAFLFGSISTVQQLDLWYIGGLALISLVLVGVFYKQLFFAAMDEEAAKISGAKPEWMNVLLVVLTAVTVTLAMRVVGILLVGALMIIPVVSAMQIARSFRQSLFLAIGLGLVSVIGGLFLAFYLSLPAGGVIVLLSLLIFLCLAVVSR